MAFLSGSLKFYKKSFFAWLKEWDADGMPDQERVHKEAV